MPNDTEFRAFYETIGEALKEEIEAYLIAVYEAERKEEGKQ